MDGLLLFRQGFQNREGADSLPLRVKIRARTLKVRELGDDYLIVRPARCVNEESGAECHEEEQKRNEALANNPFLVRWLLDAWSSFHLKPHRCTGRSSGLRFIPRFRHTHQMTSTLGSSN